MKFFLKNNDKVIKIQKYNNKGVLIMINSLITAFTLSTLGYATSSHSTFSSKPTTLENSPNVGTDTLTTPIENFEIIPIKEITFPTSVPTIPPAEVRETSERRCEGHWNEDGIISSMSTCTLIETSPYFDWYGIPLNEETNYYPILNDGTNCYAVFKDADTLFWSNPEEIQHYASFLERLDNFTDTAMASFAEELNDKADEGLKWAKSILPNTKFKWNYIPNPSENIALSTAASKGSGKASEHFEFLSARIFLRAAPQFDTNRQKLKHRIAQEFKKLVTSDISVYTGLRSMQRYDDAFANDNYYFPLLSTFLKLNAGKLRRELPHVQFTPHLRYNSRGGNDQCIYISHRAQYKSMYRSFYKTDTAVTLRQSLSRPKYSEDNAFNRILFRFPKGADAYLNHPNAKYKVTEDMVFRLPTNMLEYERLDTIKWANCVRTTYSDVQEKISAHRTALTSNTSTTPPSSREFSLQGLLQDMFRF